jgi:SAM-dependent methyltransferase
MSAPNAVSCVSENFDSWPGGTTAALRALFGDLVRRLGRVPRAIEVGASASCSRLEALGHDLPLVLLDGSTTEAPDLVLIHPEMEFEPLVRTLYTLRAILSGDTLLCGVAIDAHENWPAMRLALQHFIRDYRIDGGLWIAEPSGIEHLKSWPAYDTIAPLVQKVHQEQVKHRQLDNTVGVGLARETVIWAYRLMLDREPKGTEIEDRQRFPDTGALRRELVQSEEFRQKNGSLFWPSFSGDEPAMAVQLGTTEAEREALFAHVQATWEHLGKTEPHWSVLTAEQFKQARISGSEEAFYRTGAANVQTLWRTLERNGVDPKILDVCLEYGCGLGRVTRWLAERFSAVYGYDISRAHLDGAADYLARQGVGNVELRHISGPADLDRLARADLVYSVIVLQHNPPPVIEAIVTALLNALNAGGVACFQVPTYQRGYRFVSGEYLMQRAGCCDMEMHVLPQSRVFELADACGARVLEVFEDKWTGITDGGRSNTFLLRKIRCDG